jgi:predicted signal transduction protein with EAL and GGDEF domain
MFVAQMQPNQVTLCAVILSALAGGTITILAASTLLSVFYMSCLLIPFVIMGFFNSFEYFYYISFLGIIFWFVMLASARQIGKFLTEVLKLKNENAKVLKLMDAEQKEVERVNEALTGANSMLDSYASRLETEVESRTQELFRLSNIDSLTNLKNRTAFLKRIKEVLRDASSTDSANGNEGQYL